MKVCSIKESNSLKSFTEYAKSHTKLKEIICKVPNRRVKIEKVEQEIKQNKIEMDSSAEDKEFYQKYKQMLESLERAEEVNHEKERKYQ